MERFKKECQKFLDTLLKHRRIMTIRLDITFLDQNEKQSRKILSRILKKLQKDYNGLLVDYHGIFEFNGTKSKDKYHTHLLLCFDGNKKISIPTMQDGIKKWLKQESDRNNYYISFNTPYYDKEKDSAKLGNPCTLLKTEESKRESLYKKLPAIFYQLFYLTKYYQQDSVKGNGIISKHRS